MHPDEKFVIDVPAWKRTTEGWRGDIAYAYLCALINYKCNHHCKGLENNSELIRRICCIDSKEEWDEHIFHFIFDNQKHFIMDENGLWQQEFCTQIYEEELKTREKAIRRGKLGAKIRWKKK